MADKFSNCSKFKYYFNSVRVRNERQTLFQYIPKYNSSFNSTLNPIMIYSELVFKIAYPFLSQTFQVSKTRQVSRQNIRNLNVNNSNKLSNVDYSTLLATIRSRIKTRFAIQSNPRKNLVQTSSETKDKFINKQNEKE